MAGPESAKGSTRKCPEGMIEISAGPIGDGRFKGEQVAAFCIDQGPMENIGRETIQLTPASSETRYEVIVTMPSGSRTLDGQTEAQVRQIFRQFTGDLQNLRNSRLPMTVSFSTTSIDNAVEVMPQSPRRFDGDHQPLVYVSLVNRKEGGKTVLGAEEICRRRGLQAPTPQRLARAAGGPKQLKHSSDDGTLKQSAIHYCADYRSDDPKVCPQTTRDVGASRGKGVYVSWPQSDGTSAEYYDGNGNVWTWARAKDGVAYLCGGSWFNDDPEFLRAGYCRNGIPGDSGNGLGFRCVASPQGSR